MLCFTAVVLCCRQLNMLMMMMQVQPDMISLIRGGQSALLQELERRNKLKELEVSDTTQLSLHLCVDSKSCVPVRAFFCTC